MDSEMLRRAGHRHPVNVAHYEVATRGERAADRVAAFIGSWKFIGLQTVLVLLWIGANLWLLSRPFDPYPFILLNLLFSTQAAYASPLILLAGNRQAQRDRMTLEHAAAETDIEEKQNVDLLAGNKRILEQLRALDHKMAELERLLRGSSLKAP